MRRLTEILAFPKAWYRRTIIRRLFLGDLSSGMSYSEGDKDFNTQNEYLESSFPKYDRHNGDILSKTGTDKSPTLNRSNLRLSFDNILPNYQLLKGE